MKDIFINIPYKNNIILTHCWTYMYITPLNLTWGLVLDGRSQTSKR